MSGPLSLRRCALLVGGAFAVHQLRFIVSYGDDAHRVFDEPGHSYLPFAGAAAAALLLLAASEFGRSLLRAARGRTPECHRSRLRRSWAENAVALVAIYVAQEGLEGAFTPGHPIWAHGGWTVVPLAVAIGGFVALLLVGADRALDVVAGRAAGPPRSRRVVGKGPRRPDTAVLARLDVVARHLAGRAPPGAASPAA